MAVRFQLRRDTAANWTSANPTLALGEPGVETDTLKVKVGTGTTAWNSLAYSITKDFNDLTNPPTTLAGYGITDALSLSTLSVIVASAGVPNLSYNNVTGEFTYTPPLLGTAAAEDVGYFATAAQGSTADTAVQPGDNIQTSIIDSADSSAITITPDVVMSAGLTVGNHILPSSTLNIDIGSDTARFRDIYLSGNTVNLGGTAIGRTADGDIEIKDHGTQQLKTVVVNELKVGNLRKTFSDTHVIDTTSDLTEGTNLYYTDARVDARLAGGSVGNIVTTGYIAGPATFVIDPAAVGDNTGVVVIAGNLQVDGTTTTINSTTVAIDDLNFSIATDAADSAAANGAGISIGGAGATLNYTHATTSWDMNKPLNVTGDIGVTGTITSDGLTVDGDVLLSDGANYTDQTVKISTGGATVGNRSILAFADQRGSETAKLIGYNSSYGSGLNKAVEIEVDGSKVARFYDGGDISFYEDTGTTAKFFWDASAERLGIGETSPGEILHAKTAGDTSLRLESSAASTKVYNITAGGGGNYSAGVFAIRNVTDATTPLSIFQDRIGINTTNPLARFSVHQTNTQFTNSTPTAQLYHYNYPDDNTTNVPALDIRVGNTSADLKHHGTLQLRQLFSGGEYTSPHIQLHTNANGSNDKGIIGMYAGGGNTPQLTIYSDLLGSTESNVDIVENSLLRLSSSSLQVNQTTTTAPSLTFGAAAGQILRNEDAEFAFGLSNAAPYNLWMQGRYTANTSRDIAIQPLGGNVGIGTTSPDYTLDVSHGTTSEYVATFQNTADNLELKIGTITGGLLNIQGVTVNNNTAYDIALQAEGGNVGIGQNSPIAKLHVGSDTSANISNQSLYISGTKTGFASFAGLPMGQLTIYDDTAGTAGSGGAIGFAADGGGGQKTWIAAIDSQRDSATTDGTNYGGSLNFYTRPPQSTPIKATTISSAGIVTMPYQPAMFAQPDSAGNVQVGTGANIYGWNTSGGVRFNRGFTISGASGLTLHFNAGNTGRITVPSAGVYQLYFDMRCEATGGDGQAGVRINGTQYIRRHIEMWAHRPYTHMIVQATFNLQAGDYLEMGMWWNNTTGGALSGTNDTVNWMSLQKIA